MPAWETRPALPAPRQEVAVVALGRTIHVIGGFDDGPAVVNSVLEFHVDTDTWTSGVPLPRALHHVNAAVVDGAILVLGALEEPGFRAVGDVLSWRPGEPSWTVLPSMPAGRQRGASAVGVHGTRVFLAGGWRGGSVADCDVYDAAASSWTTCPDLPGARDHMVGAVVGEQMVVASGRNGAVLERVDLLHVDTLTWSAGQPITTARAGTMGAVVNGLLVVMGGEGNAARADGMYDHVEALDVATGGWRSLPVMMPAIHGTGAAVVDGVIHVPGGATVQGFGAVAQHRVLRMRP